MNRITRKSTMNVTEEVTDVQVLQKKNKELAKALNIEKEKSAALLHQLNSERFPSCFKQFSLDAFDSICPDIYKYCSEAMGLINSCVTSSIQASTAIANLLEVAKRIETGSKQNGRVNNLNSLNKSPGKQCNDSTNKTRAVRPMIHGHSISFPTVKIHRVEREHENSLQAQDNEEVEENMESESTDENITNSGDFINVNRRKPQNCNSTPPPLDTSLPESTSKSNSAIEELSRLSTLLEVTENVTVTENSSTTSAIENHMEDSNTINPLPVISELDQMIDTPSINIPSSTPFSTKSPTLSRPSKRRNSQSPDTEETPKRFNYDRRHSLKNFANRISNIVPVVVLERISAELYPPNNSKEGTEDRNDASIDTNLTESGLDQTTPRIIHEPTKREKKIKARCESFLSNLPFLYDGPCTSSFILTVPKSRGSKKSISNSANFSSTRTSFGNHIHSPTSANDSDDDSDCDVQHSPISLDRIKKEETESIDQPSNNVNSKEESIKKDPIKKPIKRNGGKRITKTKKSFEHKTKKSLERKTSIDERKTSIDSSGSSEPSSSVGDGSLSSGGTARRSSRRKVHINFKEPSLILKMRR